VSALSLAELYATLSATPSSKMRRLDHVLDAVEHAARVFTPVSLSSANYLWMLRHAPTVEARSGLAYDALILKCTERAHVDIVYTWNVAHFRRIAWPDLNALIREP
jgi:hypothetical protein